jgi:hypothetical protein
MEWINVKNELPKKSEHLSWCSKNVLCLTDGKQQYICFYHTANKCFYDYSLMAITEHKITHWMPLPEPPNN